MFGRAVQNKVFHVKLQSVRCYADEIRTTSAVLILASGTAVLIAHLQRALTHRISWAAYINNNYCSPIAIQFVQQDLCKLYAF